MQDVYLYTLRTKRSDRKSAAGRRYYQLVCTPQDMLMVPDDTNFLELKNEIETRPHCQHYVAINYLGELAPLQTVAWLRPGIARRVEECIRWFSSGKADYMVFEDHKPALYNYTGEEINLYSAGLLQATLPVDGKALEFILKWGDFTAPVPLSPQTLASSAAEASFPVSTLETEYCESLPDSLGVADFAIVSLPYARAYRMTYGDDARLLCVHTPVRDEAGVTIGYAGLYHPPA